MPKQAKSDLQTRVVLAARNHGIQSVLFRSLIASRLGLNVTDMECLGLLFHQKVATPTELARHTGLTSGAATAMLDRLERSGLIQRQPNPNDRRGTLITLVASGAEKIAPWFASVRAAERRLVASYSESELRLLADFFERSARMWEQERQALQSASAVGE